MIRFIPKEEKFFDFFERASKNIKEAANLLKDMIDGFENISDKAKRIKEIEHEGDMITHETIAKLNKTFVTPLDREDIHSLISAMDDVLDYIEAVADRMVIYKIKYPTQDMKELVDSLLTSTEVIDKLIPELRDLKNSQRILDYCIEINRLENEGDRLLKSAVAKLFDLEKDPVEIIKWKEIYETVEMGLDMCEDVANVIEGVMLKKV